jgi:hypothetical protein
MSTNPLARAALVIVLPAALAACAGMQERSSQLVEVRVEAEDAGWAGPLECLAFNAAGEWPFAAPGTVAVKVSSPLRITCKVPSGVSAEDSTTRAVPTDASWDAARAGEKAGMVAGGAVGVVAIAAAAPVMGAGLGLVTGLGAIFQGSQMGGAAGFIGSGARTAYPSPIVLRITPAGSSPGPRPVPIPGPYGPYGRHAR